VKSILSRVKALPQHWTYQWGKLRTSIIIGAQGVALANLFYCRPNSSPHKQPVYQPLDCILAQVQSVMYGLYYCLLGCLGQD
jgi:hypothetical protein